MKSNNIETSVVAEDATITGNVDFVGTLIVEGEMEGEIKGADMTVQKSGKIKGTLNVDALNCHGAIEGDIKARHIIAHSSAVLTGEVEANTIEMSPGAQLNGQVTMATTNPQAAKSKTPPSTNPGSSNQGSTTAPDGKKGKASKLSDLVLD